MLTVWTLGGAKMHNSYASLVRCSPLSDLPLSQEFRKYCKIVNAYLL